MGVGGDQRAAVECKGCQWLIIYAGQWRWVNHKPVKLQIHQRIKIHRIRFHMASRKKQPAGMKVKAIRSIRLSIRTRQTLKTSWCNMLMFIRCPRKASATFNYLSKMKTSICIRWREESANNSFWKWSVIRTYSMQNWTLWNDLNLWKRPDNWAWDFWSGFNSKHL